jgi:hypothetical protein
MIGSLIAQLGELERVLDELGEGEAARKGRRIVASMARELTERMTLDGSSITVEEEQESYAIEAVTAYLDGAARGDGFELLGETVARGCTENHGEIEWLAGVVAALARLAGDLSVLAAARDGRSEWDDALRIIQQLARP